ncbi:MAG TPA: hypothetical protein VH143_25795 [Kofleriaceae bacterium]|jgi:hypothetical protein|nr:hypothetical protein [Kofleriaceae bacterium]
MAKRELITVDRALVALEHGSYWIVRNRAAITPAFVRELLTRDSNFARHMMLKLAVPLDCSDDELMQHWHRAAEASRGLDLTYGWGSKQRKERFRELAADHEMLAAIQGAVAMHDSPPIDMLAVLVADGGDASIDALIPHLGGALESGDARVNWLRDLCTHAADTPRLNALFAELDATYTARNASSPALALGAIIGLGELDELWFDFGANSTKLDSFRASVVQGSVRVDSRTPNWFNVWVSSSGAKGFSGYGVDAVPAVDRLGLGPCEPAQLPAWLANAAETLDVDWLPFAPMTNLRGKKRARLTEWLSGK